jgi:hypothetical protein
MEQNSQLQSQLHATNLREIAAHRSLSALKQDLSAARQHARDSVRDVPALQQLADQHAVDIKVPFVCMPCLFSCHVCLLQFQNHVHNPCQIWHTNKHPVHGHCVTTSFGRVLWSALHC